MASPTRWTWVWVNSGVGDRQGGLVRCVWFMGSQRVGHDWATELNWIWYRGFKELSCWGTHPHQKGDAPQLHGDSSGEVPALRILLRLGLCFSSSVYSAVSFILPFNKLVFVFPWVLWASLANSQPWGGGCRNLLCIACWSEAQRLRLVSEVGVGVVLWDWAPTCGIWRQLLVNRVRIELNPRTPSWCLRLTCYLGTSPNTKLDDQQCWNEMFCASVQETWGERDSGKNCFFPRQEGKHWDFFIYTPSIYIFQ